MAGAPFFFGEAEGVALGLGVSLGPGDAEADSSGDGVGVGELLCFFFLPVGLEEDSGDALGEDFFFFADGDALAFGVSAGVGLAVAFFFGVADFSADAVGLGVGDFSAVDFFFVCFRGVGVGVGTKIFLSFVPKSSAGARTANEMRIVKQTKIVIPSAVEGPRRMSLDAPRDPSTSLRFARDDTLCRASYFFASSARTALFSRIPPSKFSSGKFSFGE